jgi:hypothetical protein
MLGLVQELLIHSGKANTFRKTLDLPEVTWNKVEIPDTGENVSSNTKQTSLSDFLK